MAEYHVSIRTLKAKAEELEQLNAAMNNMISSLQETELSLSGMWEGSANRAFHKAFMHDIMQLKKFHNTIRIYIMALYEAIKKYARAEHSNTRIARERTYYGSSHGSDYCAPAPVVHPVFYDPADFDSVVESQDEPENV